MIAILKLIKMKLKSNKSIKISILIKKENMIKKHR